MINCKLAGVRYLVCIVACLACTPLYSQIVQFGVKGGAQLSWARSDDPQFRKQVKIQPIPGYNAGFVLSFKVKDRYFLHTEYLFSTKGKVVRGRIDKKLEDRITYNYIEVPILYNIHFKGSLGSTRKFKWYAGAGPLFSYWLGGKGWIHADEFEENSFPPFNYKIRFGERGEDIKDYDIIYIKDARRLQLGFALGGVFFLNPPAAER